MGNYVLVVDDQPDVRHLIMELLTATGIRGREASNGQQALDAVHQELPGAIVLDLMMPVMNGFTFITQLQGDRSKRSIPIILLSGIADDVQMGHLPGVIGVLRKGNFTLLELQTLINSAMDRNRVLA